jgi:hypothetical protein
MQAFNQDVVRSHFANPLICVYTPKGFRLIRDAQKRIELEIAELIQAGIDEYLIEPLTGIENGIEVVRYSLTEAGYAVLFEGAS